MKSNASVSAGLSPTAYSGSCVYRIQYNQPAGEEVLDAGVEVLAAVEEVLAAGVEGGREPKTGEEGARQGGKQMRPKQA